MYVDADIEETKIKRISIFINKPPKINAGMSCEDCREFWCNKITINQ